MTPKKSDIEYTYAIQMRWEGEKLWEGIASRYPTLDKARAEIDRIKKNYKRLELRIVRRPKIEWEVVE